MDADDVPPPLPEAEVAAFEARAGRLLAPAPALALSLGLACGGLLVSVCSSGLSQYKRWSADGTWPKIEALIAAPAVKPARRPTPRALPPAPASRTRPEARPGRVTAP